MKWLWTIALGVCLACAMRSLLASEQGMEMGGDPRVQVVPYESGNVVKVKAAKGVSMLIVLNAGERILAHSTGFDSDCEVEKGASWCIIANAGGHLIWVKPLSQAKMTDLQVVTDKRIYSFELDAMPVPRIESAAPLYRLVFTYPQDELAAKLLQLQAQVTSARDRFTSSVAAAQAEQAQLNKIEAPQIMQVKNTDYVLATAKGSDDIKPTEVFDDGRFVYLQFGAGKSVPAVFTVAPDGSESQVNWFWKPDSQYMVLTRLYPHLILRKDAMRVGIWNKAYMGAGSGPLDGSTAPGTYRLIKQGKQ